MGTTAGDTVEPPVGATTTSDRRSTYVFALEQAEQMFRAAATVGPATRPLLVFYGLSQAGRSIAAAATRIASGDDWKLSGHGISSVGLDRPLPEIEVRTGKPGKPGSFVRLSELLDSPLWGREPVRLNELWDLLPENEQSPLLDTGNRCATGRHTGRVEPEAPTKRELMARHAVDVGGRLPVTLKAGWAGRPRWSDCSLRASLGTWEENEQVTSRDGLVPEASAGSVVNVAVERSDAAMVLGVSGEVDSFTADQMREAVLRALDERPAVLVIDLLGVRFLASAGLAVLVEAHHVAAGHTRLRVVAPAR